MELEINGSEYRTAKLSVFSQLHVSRKISPILPRLVPALNKLSAMSQSSQPEDIDVIAEAFEPVAEGLAAMSEADCEYVIGTALETVTRNQTGAWVPVWNKAAKAPMFDDMDLPILLQIAARVIWGNLGGFISGRLASPAVDPQRNG